MNEFDKDTREEFRIIGHHGAGGQFSGKVARQRVPDAEDESRRRKRGVGIISAVIVLAIGVLTFIFWPKEAVEDPNNGVFENTNPQPSSTVAPETAAVFGTETEGCFAEKVDTVMNDISISLYIPHNAVPELMVGRPDMKDKDIILIAQAADIRGDNYKILGAFVLQGNPLAWGLSKKGFCAIIDGKITVGTSENSPLFEEATEKGGFFFRQFPLVDNRVLVENEIKNKSVRKALCSRSGEIFIAVTNSPESFHDFSQALVDLGVENAVSLVGSSKAFGWYVDEGGEQTMFGEDIHKYENENYVLWKKHICA